MSAAPMPDTVFGFIHDNADNDLDNFRENRLNGWHEDADDTEEVLRDVANYVKCVNPDDSVPYEWANDLLATLDKVNAEYPKPTIGG